VKGVLGRTRSFLAFASAALAIASSSCASGVILARGIEPECLLPPGAPLYVKLDRATLGEAVGRMAGYPVAVAASSVLERIDSVVMSMATAPDGSGPTLLGVARGDFPVAAARWGLSGDSSWKRVEREWIHDPDGFRLVLGSRDMILIGTGSLVHLVEAAAAPHDHPVPDAWLDLWAGSDVALCLPAPMDTLGTGFGFEAGAMPLESVALGAVAEAGGYVAVMGFRFGSERSALVFSPVCKLFVYALARSLATGDSAGIAEDVRWTVEGVTVMASGLRFTARDFAELFARLGS